MVWHSVSIRVSLGRVRMSADLVGRKNISDLIKWSLGTFPSANNQFVHEIQIECNCVSSVLSMNIFMCVPGNRTQGFARDLDYVLWRYAQAFLKLTFGEILRAEVVMLLINIRWHIAGQHYMNTNRLEAWEHQQPLHFFGDYIAFFIIGIDNQRTSFYQNVLYRYTCRPFG